MDGSDTTKAGLEAIGMNADEVAKKMSKGGETAKKTYKQVVDKLADMDDQQARNIAGVNLFGTMWEDLGPEALPSWQFWKEHMTMYPEPWTRSTM